MLRCSKGNTITLTLVKGLILTASVEFLASSGFFHNNCTRNFYTCVFRSNFKTELVESLLKVLLTTHMDIK